MDDDVFDELLTPDDKEESHWQIVARVLFIYAKLNPGQGYVQGMNEIIGPLYYTFTNDCDEDWNVSCVGIQVPFTLIIFILTLIIFILILVETLGSRHILVLHRIDV